MNPPPASAPYKSAVATAWIAAAFLLCVCAGMVYQRVTASSNDPWKSPQLLELKEHLRESPQDERIKERIRELDLKFRQRYFRRLATDSAGAWLLFGGTIVLVLALKTAADARKRPPMPRLDHDAGARALQHAELSRRAVGITGGILVVAMLATAFGIRSSLTEASRAAGLAAGGAEAATRPLPTPAEYLANWPRFRGPTGSGVATRPEAPLTWDAGSGAAIAWKTPVPAPGFNSPIVWRDRLFLSGATGESREVFCYDTTSGALLWQRAIDKIPGSPAEPPHVLEETGYAAPTMATDGHHVYAMFANGDLAAMTFDGRIVWAKNLGLPRNPYGHATSLLTWEGNLLVQLDQGETRPQNSRLLAFDGTTGRQLWEKARPVPSSWTTPIVIEAAGKPQLVTVGEPFVIAYAPRDGTEIWRADILHGEVAPSPIFVRGLLLVIHPDNKMLAVRPDGSGDVSATPPVWTADDHIPDVTSPVSDGELVFTVTSRGFIACFDFKDGKLLWEHNLDTEVQASPALAANRLYITGTNGVTIVAEAGREYRELARNPLGEKVYATPAFVGGRIFFRGTKHVYCIAAAEPAQETQ
jgi:outer membrane protein assembly factor BamB